jgi:hypothetical protein
MLSHSSASEAPPLLPPETQVNAGTAAPERGRRRPELAGVVIPTDVFAPACVHLVLRTNSKLIGLLVLHRAIARAPQSCQEC